MKHLPVRTTDTTVEFDFEADNVKTMWIEGPFELKTFDITLDDNEAVHLVWDHLDSWHYAFEPGKYLMLQELLAAPIKRYPVVLFDTNKLAAEMNGQWDTATDTAERFSAAKRFRLTIHAVAADISVWTIPA